ncbi:MAG: patatin [Symploca sp. SIO3C6]|nr:patatin [Symploca sp. SIO3C6]
MKSSINTQLILTFDGQDDYIDIGQTDLGGVLAGGSSALTISGWVRPHNLSQKTSNHGTRNVFFAQASDFYNDNLELGISPEGNLDVYFDENQDDITKTFGQGELSVGQWHFFSVVFSKGEVTVHLDDNQYTGSFKGSSLDPAAGSPVTIGATLHSDVYFNGQITHLSVWNYACSKDQIQQHRSGALKGNETGLTAYWMLNEGKGDTIQDQTANAHHGILHGKPQWDRVEMPSAIVSQLPNPKEKPDEPPSSSEAEVRDQKLASSETEAAPQSVTQENLSTDEFISAATTSVEAQQKSGSTTTKPQYKILAIDGGGIRGIIPAVILAEIEKRTQKPIFSLFDLIAGTSTGGILALGLTKPKLDLQAADSKPKAQYSAEDFIEMYLDKGDEIFYEPFVEKLLGPIEDFLFQPKYASSTREEVLREYLGDTPLERCLTEIFVTSYDLEEGIPILFTSKVGKQQIGSRSFRKLCRGFTFKDAGMATSAIPTYFPPYRVYTTQNNGGYYALIDGGLVANNPTALAILEAENNAAQQGKTLHAQDILIVSLGTGALTETYKYDDVRNWGILQWTRPLLNLVLDGGSEVIAGQLERSLKANYKDNSSLYYRFQTSLTRELGIIDNTQRGNILRLKTLAEQIIEDRTEEIDQLCDLLTQ